MLRAGAVVWLASSLALGCAKREERAPITCLGDCGLDPGQGSGLPDDSAGGSGSNGEGGSGNTADGVELTGNVFVLSDELDFDAGTLLTGNVDFKAEGESGKTVSGHWNGSDPYVVKGVRRTAGAWVLSTPQNAVADDVLPSLQPVRTDLADSDDRYTVTLELVRATTMDQVMALASIPLTRNPDRAQIVLLVGEKAKGAGSAPPLPGVTVRAPSAEDVLYGASGGFSDVDPVTDTTGLVVLANVPGADWPGALVSVEFSGVKTSGAQIRAVNGAVTLARIAP